MVEEQSKQSQCQRILDYINRFMWITSADAMDDLGCFRLASRIHDLKKKGYPIIDTWVVKKNRYGEFVRYKAYGLEGVSWIPSN